MSKQTMTKSQLREAINGLGPLAPDWLVEALEDFIELQEAHKNLLAMHAEDAYHLEEARAKLQAPAIDERAEFEKWANEHKGGEPLQVSASGNYPNPFANAAYEAWQARAKLSALVTVAEVVSKTTDTIVPDAKDEIDHDGIWTNSDVAEQRYIQGWNDCRAAMQANCDAMLKGGEMNEYGLNADYLTMNFRVLLRDIERYTPDEMHRALLRLAETIKPVVPDEIETAYGLDERSEYANGWNDCRAAMQANCDAMLKGEK